MTTTQPTAVPRRAVLGAVAVSVGLTACRSDTGGPFPEARPDGTEPAATTTPVAPVTEDAVLHLLRRATFGARPDLRDEVERLGRDTWLDEQLHADPSTLDLENELLDALPELALPAPELVALVQAKGAPASLARQLVFATLVRQVASPFQLHERMVEFWSDHLHVPVTDQLSIPLKIVDHRTVARALALGRFDDLLVASATSPAMLRYLDNAQSFRGAINENYARELLELHTVGVDGGYDETDVVAVARLLTGWTVDRGTVEFRFDDRRHDPGPVEVLGWTRPADGDPRAHGELFLRHLATHPATAQHLCRKLARRFVADDPPADIVDAMAATWQSQDSAIAPVLRTMFDHPSFDGAPAKFQRPWDHLVQTLRALGTIPNLTADPKALRRLTAAAQELGQTPYRWPAPNGYPDVEGAWHDAGGILTRWRVTAAVVGEALTNREAFRTTDLTTPEFVMAETTDAAGVVREIHRMLRGETATDDLAAELLDVAGWAPDDAVDMTAVADASARLLFAVLADPAASYR